MKTKMKKSAPQWALKLATSQDRQRAQDAYRKGTWQITWPEKKSLRIWARRQGWPAPRFFFDRRFIETMLASDANFALAVNESGLRVFIPMEHYEISPKQLKALDALYEKREDMGALGSRPTRWGTLVEELREIRRAVEANVMIEVEGRKLENFDDFISWAHGRYHALEDGYDSWYGDDDS